TRREVIRLEELALEINAEFRTLRPAGTLKWRLGANAVLVSAHRRPLHEGLRQLFCSLLPMETAAAVRVEIHSRRVVGGVELSVATVAPSPASTSLEWILAQELLGACGGTLWIRLEPGQGNLLTLTVPSSC